MAESGPRGLFAGPCTATQRTMVMLQIDSSPSCASRMRDAGPTACLMLLIAGLACYRFTLIDAGHFFWGDEQRYLVAEAVVDDLAAGDYRSALARPYTCAGRPGFVFVSVIPVLLQRVVCGWARIGRDALHYYDIVSGISAVITLGITVCLFALGRVWTRSGWYGLMIAGTYSLLCHANVWIRHLMPYYGALLMFLASLWLVSSEPRSERQAARRASAAGLLSAAGHACYPGYYAFVAINLVVLLAASRRRARALLWFAGSSAAVFVALEILARFAGTSYLRDILATTGTCHISVQGWRREGFVFAWRYLRDVEGAIGVVLFVLFLGFVGGVLWRRAARLSTATRAALGAAVACYLLHASLSVFAERTAFYGRILGMYLPLLTGGAVLGLIHLRRTRIRRLAVCGVMMASCWSFVTFARQYARVTYPADLLARTMAEKGRAVTYPPNALLVNEGNIPDRPIESVDPHLVMVVDTCPEGFVEGIFLVSHEAARTSGARFIGVNFKYMSYIWEKDHRFSPSDNYRIIAEAIHPNAFPATGYEGRRPWERRRLRQRRYAMRLYERTDGPAPAALTSR